MPLCFGETEFTSVYVFERKRVPLCVSLCGGEFCPRNGDRYKETQPTHIVALHREPAGAICKIGLCANPKCWSQWPFLRGIKSKEEPQAKNGPQRRECMQV